MVVTSTCQTCLSNVECGSNGSIFTARLSWLLSGTRQVKTLSWMKKKSRREEIEISLFIFNATVVMEKTLTMFQIHAYCVILMTELTTLKLNLLGLNSLKIINHL